MKNWDTRLLAWAQKHRGAPFAWGRNDCGLLCAEAHDLVAGSNIAAAWRGVYSTEFGAKRATIEWDTDLAQVLRQAGCVDVPPGFHRRGDFLLYGERWIYGHVCLGLQSLSSIPDAGVVLIPTPALIERGCYVLRPACLH